jgi:hypothetical protein
LSIYQLGYPKSCQNSITKFKFPYS